MVRVSTFVDGSTGSGIRSNVLWLPDVPDAGLRLRDDWNRHVRYSKYCHVPYVMAMFGGKHGEKLGQLVGMTVRMTKTTAQEEGDQLGGFR